MMTDCLTVPTRESWDTSMKIEAEVVESEAKYAKNSSIDANYPKRFNT
jgi:hypothetical protein